MLNLRRKFARGIDWRIYLKAVLFGYRKIVTAVSGSSVDTAGAAFFLTLCPRTER
jgi:hypothetical protein